MITFIKVTHYLVYKQIKNPAIHTPFLNVILYKKGQPRTAT